MGNLVHMDQSNTVHHLDPRECVYQLKEQIRYMEQYRLEHDTRYCDLEKAVGKITEGRRAALAESRTLKAIRENPDAALLPHKTEETLKG